MTQQFDADGECKAVTVVKAGPCRIMRVKTKESKDGYNAVLLAYGDKKEKGLNKAQLGQYKAAGTTPAKVQREFRLTDAKDFEAGQTVGLEGRFTVGDYVDVQGVSKGKGFAGVMKRHNFGGLPASHGASDKERSPGSIASRRSLGRVVPGQRMAGHMGHVTVTVHKLEVVSIEPENNLVYLNGSVPGPRGSVIVVKETTKTMKKKPVKQKAKGPKKDKMGNIIK
jgi:large subunit ribosomal protein L3